MTTAPHWYPLGRRVGVGQADPDFFKKATAQLQGQVSAVEGQALSAMQGWAAEAQDEILSNLDPNLTPLINGAVTAAQTLSGGFTPQAFFSIAGMAASAIGGPVAGALVGSMMVTLNVIGDAVTEVFKILGIQATTSPAIDPNALCAFGWAFNDQILPATPVDKGNGTYQNPGWQSVWAQFQAMGAAGVYTCNGINSDKFYAFRNGMPSYLHQVIMPATNIDAYIWCELQSVPQSDFRWFFYPLWYQNLDYLYNCSPMPPVDAQLLLVEAVKAWNLAHEPGTPQVYNAAISSFAKHESWISQIMAGVPNATSINQKPQLPANLAISTGPAVPATRVVSLHIGTAVDSALAANEKAAVAAAAPTGFAALSTPAKVAVVGASVTGAALVGTAIFAFAKGRAVDAVWKGIWKSVTRRR